jgi:hypothetical protein
MANKKRRHLRRNMAVWSLDFLLYPLPVLPRWFHFYASTYYKQQDHTTCSATAATNYPSLGNPPNGCQGHLRPCLAPPDRSMVTVPDSNDVRTRSIYSTISIDDINAQSGWSLKTEKIRINNMYTLILFIQYGIYFWHELTYTLHYIS